MGGSKSSNSASKAEKKRQAQITAGTSAINKQFEGFNDDFYAARGQEYSDWANPQMQDQYDKAQKELTFALARQFGSLDTSEAAARQALLAKTKAQAEASIVDSAGQYKNKVQGDVEAQRANLLAQLNASADAGSASSGALTASKMLLDQKGGYEPLADFFANITEGLAAANYPQGIVSNITGLFKNPATSNKGAQTIVA